MAPSFVEDRRRAALEVYESQELPTWRRSGFWTTTLRGLDLDALEPKRYEPGLASTANLGDDDHSALIVQRGANVVHSDLDDEQIVVMPLEQAVEEHAELVEQHFAKAAAVSTTASSPLVRPRSGRGGVFVHVPKNVRDREADPGRLAHRRAGHGPVGAHARRGRRARRVSRSASSSSRGDFDGQALHAGAFELYADTGAQVRPRALPGLGPRARCTICPRGGSRSAATRA